MFSTISDNSKKINFVYILVKKNINYYMIVFSFSLGNRRSHLYICLVHDLLERSGYAYAGNT